MGQRTPTVSSSSLGTASRSQLRAGPHRPANTNRVRHRRAAHSHRSVVVGDRQHTSLLAVIHRPPFPRSPAGQLCLPKRNWCSSQPCHGSVTPAPCQFGSRAWTASTTLSVLRRAASTGKTPSPPPHEAEAGRGQRRQRLARHSGDVDERRHGRCCGWLDLIWLFNVRVIPGGIKVR